MTNARNLGDLGRDTNLTEFGEAFTLPTSDGTTGQVLQTNGSGTLTFADAGGGGLELLSTVTCNDTFSAVDLPLSSAYNAFLLQFVDVRNTGYDFTRMLASEDGGSTYSAGTIGYSYSEFMSAGTGPSSTSSSAYLPIYAARSAFGQLFINNSDNAMVLRGEIIVNTQVPGSANYSKNLSLAYRPIVTSRADYIRIYNSNTNNYTSGEIYLYGFAT